MRRATESDRPRIEALLARDPVQAMFPLANLATFGWEGDHPYAVRFWLNDDGDVLAVTRSGLVLPVLPGGDTGGAAAALAGQEVSGLIGPADQCRPLAGLLDLAGQPTLRDQDEPQFRLDLAALEVPPGPGALQPLTAMPRLALVSWRRRYLAEIHGSTEAEMAEAADSEIATYIAAGSHRVLMEGDTPLAMTGFNARLTEVVQVGGVYTPPVLRGRGHARRAVALHLAEAMRTGARIATLLAASPAAQRAYEGLGFTRIGVWTMLMLRKPVRVG